MLRVLALLATALAAIPQLAPCHAFATGSDIEGADRRHGRIDLLSSHDVRHTVPLWFGMRKKFDQSSGNHLGTRRERSSTSTLQRLQCCYFHVECERQNVFSGILSYFCRICALNVLGRNAPAAAETRRSW